MFEIWLAKPEGIHTPLFLFLMFIIKSICGLNLFSAMLGSFAFPSLEVACVDSYAVSFFTFNLSLLGLLLPPGATEKFYLRASDRGD